MNNMKERPILMSTEMVQSNLKGWKTQTRRTRGLELINGSPCNYHPAGDFIDSMGRSCKIMRHTLNDRYHPPRSVVCGCGKPGDILWVRETWQTTYNRLDDQWCPIYRADGGIWIDDDGRMRWKPSIHMPKKFARIWLRITDIRLERLWTITWEDATQEGVARRDIGALKALVTGRYEPSPPEYLLYNTTIWGPSPIKSFETLWIKINGADSWMSNPWVWAISFEVLSTTGRPESFHQLTSAS